MPTIASRRTSAGGTMGADPAPVSRAMAKRTRQGGRDPLGVVTDGPESQHGSGYRTPLARFGLVAPMAMAIAARSSSDRLCSERPPRTGLA